MASYTFEFEQQGGLQARMAAMAAGCLVQYGSRTHTHTPREVVAFRSQRKRRMADERAQGSQHMSAARRSNVATLNAIAHAYRMYMYFVRDDHAYIFIVALE